MPEYSIVLTWEAIYDVTDIADYIEAEFGEQRADRFQMDMENELSKLRYMGNSFLNTQILYRGYSIHKKPFPPSIIFFVLMNDEIHILRVLREEQDWKGMLERNPTYSYPGRE